MPPVPKTKCRSYDALTDAPLQCMEKLEQSKNDDRPDFASKQERRIRHWKDKLEEHKEAVKEAYVECKSLLTLGQPFTQEGVTEDPRKTIVVGRLNYDTTEEKLKNEFSIYGDIKMVRLIRDQKGNSRGYAFIEFESRRDFLCKLE